jgi:formate dehydrogenase maturation protein FdhE
VSWTLERVATARPELAQLVRLHRALDERTATAVARGLELDAVLPGVPALHWTFGRSLLDAADARALAPPIARLLGELASAAGSAFPQAQAAVAELADETARPGFAWEERLSRFRDLPDDLSHPALFRFLLMRAMAVPAGRLARTISAPHAARWIPASCPWCGVPAAAEVARQGSGRTMLCILCGGRWEREGLQCAGCGEARMEKRMVLADRALGPASLEACATCRRAVKVFAPADVPEDGPLPPASTVLALEILTVHLDVVGKSQGVRREEPALAAVFPPP